jgi:drug/metabolite transporter (DMT)-like permease
MWVPVTIAAACFQTARTAMQQRLRALLSVSGAGFVRYLYGAPVAILAVAVVGSIDGLPTPPARFWPIIAGGGLAQIVGTIFMIRAFDARDFAIGTVYTKTEVVQVAVFSLVFLGEPLRPLGWLATLVCFAGVVVLAGGHRVLQVRDRAVLFGVAAGGAFALASVGIRAASRSLIDGQEGDGHVVARALVTLAVMNTMQIVMHGGYLAVRERHQLRLSLVHWRSSSVVGVLSVCGSACWALAFTLENAARVRTFGQVELLITFAVAHRFLGERHGRRELVASALVLTGVIGVMIGG